MEEELINQEVLCIFDIRKIQQYVFSNNTFKDTIGGSDIIKHILDDAIIYALKNIDTPLYDNEYDLSADPNAEIPYFNSNRIKFQLIFSVAGNAMCIVRTGELYRKIIRKMSRYFLDNTYSLNLATAVTKKTDNFRMDMFNLYKKLNYTKSSAEISDPIGALPVIVKETHTGEPAVAKDKKTGEYYSRSSILRQKEALKRKYLVDTQDIKSTVTYEGNEYIAIIHMDGNDFGITIGRILQGTSSYEDGIRVRRRVNINITETYNRVINKTLEQIKEYYIEKYGDKNVFYNAFEIMQQGGDDLNVICDAALAMPFVEMFYSNLKDTFLWKSDTLNVQLHVCTGIAFVPKNSSFHAAFKLAEDCCTSAKTEAKKERNLRDGLAGNWIDFQIWSDAGIGDFQTLREKKYITNDKIHLITRPYCFDSDTNGQPINYFEFQKLLHTIKTNELSKNCLTMLKQPYVIGKEEFENWILSMDKKGIDLVKLLGEPLYTDNEGIIHALWFDVAEFSDFIQQKRGTTVCIL